MVHTQLGQQRPWLGQDDGREVLCTLYVCDQAVYYEPVNPSYSNLNFRWSVKFPTLVPLSQLTQPTRMFMPKWLLMLIYYAFTGAFYSPSSDGRRGKL